ncbi:MAG: transposase [Oligoflexales bacterium]|nr:transposase [Oligoflexales bacterium]
MPPKSFTDKAIKYTLSESNKLTVYNCDGNLKIDNNFIKNKITRSC